MPTSECLPEESLLAISAGRISPEFQEEAYAHLEGCATCQDRLAALDDRTLSVAAALRRPALDLRVEEGGPSTVPVPAAPAASTSRLVAAETRSLLQARLRALSVATVFAAGAILAMHVSRTADEVTVVAAGRVGGVILAIAVAGALAAAVYLWRVGEVSLSRLRLIELFLVASIGVFSVHYRVATYSAIPGMDFDGEAHRAMYVQQATLLANLGWYLLIVGYGLFIPNTGRRCLSVVSGLAALSIGSLVVAGAAVEPVREQLPMLAANTSMALVLTGAMAVFGSFRISALQREVAVARRLGQYRLLKKLGAGGMGEVYLAEHALLKRPCAIKLIRPERASDPRLIQRFEREVRATAGLSHPNTVEVYDYGRTDEGTFYYVMEYLEGLSLSELVERHGPLPPERAVHLIRQLCGALREAHAAGLVHRDIKPSNAIVGRHGGKHDVVKLLDFGLVRSPADAASEGGDLTQEGMLVGTPDFMAPEQALGGRVDGRTDLYSMGVLAYYLLCGRPPFRGTSALDTLHAQARQPAPPLSEQRMGVPEDLAAVVMRCLEKSPGARFRDADELDAALAACTCAGEWTDSRAEGWWGELPGGSDAKVGGHEASSSGTVATAGGCPS